jgi:hypothetical protein
MLIRFPYQNPTRHYLLRVSYLEVRDKSETEAWGQLKADIAPHQIYNESIRDILIPPKKLLADNEKPNIHVENVSLSEPTGNAFNLLKHECDVGRGSSTTLGRRDRQEPRRDTRTLETRDE